jgi:hypothetical protein
LNAQDCVNDFVGKLIFARSLPGWQKENEIFFSVHCIEAMRFHLLKEGKSPQRALNAVTRFKYLVENEMRNRGLEWFLFVDERRCDVTADPSPGC